MAKSKTYLKVDAKEIAEALGAESVTGDLKTGKDGREYFECEIIGDARKTLKVFRLKDDELKDYMVLCDTEGQWFFHCLYLGRHVDNFYMRVSGYQILNPTRKNMKLRVVFYEKKRTA